MSEHIDAHTHTDSGNNLRAFIYNNKCVKTKLKRTKQIN